LPVSCSSPITLDPPSAKAPTPIREDRVARTSSRQASRLQPRSRGHPGAAARNVSFSPYWAPTARCEADQPKACDQQGTARRFGNDAGLGCVLEHKLDVVVIEGSATVPSEATSNLAGIAKGLTEKPGLRLDIPSAPGLPPDGVGLADQKITAAAMAKEVKKGQPADLAALELDKRHDRLEDLYKTRFKTGPKYPEPETKDEGDARKLRETDWLMAELRKSYAPSPDELAALGKARAKAVRLALLEGATPVDPARVFLSGRDSAFEKDGKARMELKLEGS
jgi:hypothetical protein